METMGRKGFSFTELMVYVVLFALFMGMATGIFYWSRQSLGGMKRLDNFQGLRMASMRITDELSYGVRILYPPVDQKVHHQLVFRNNRNEIVAVFLDKQSRLTLIDYEEFKAGKSTGKRVLADRAIEFCVERPDNHLLKFNVRILDEKNVEFVLANAVKMRNTDINEPLE